MELRTMVATVESREQDTVLKVLQIYNQEVSEYGKLLLDVAFPYL